MPPERVFQVTTLRFGSDARHEHVDRPAPGAGSGTRTAVWETWRPPPIAATRSTWHHEVRRLGSGYRLRVPELAPVVGQSAVVVGIARPDHWELRGRRRSDRVTTVVNVDGRSRVVVPQGVRHRLGLAGEVVVSTNPDLAVVRIWSAVRLDELIGGEE